MRNSQSSFHDSVYDGMKWFAILFPWLWGTRELVSSSKSKWEDVGRYIDYDIHTDYSEMIGAVDIKTTEYTTGWWFFKKTHTETVKVYYDHDGMITSKDAILDKTNVTNVKVKGVNHMEMGKHYMMYSILNNALTWGDYGPAFMYNNY